MTISSRSYKDQAADGQSELEKYLTPALVDFFNRLDKSEKVTFIEECFLRGSNSNELSSKMITQLENSKGLSARYRFKIPYSSAIKYPDITIFGKNLMVLIESRIVSGITQTHGIQEKANGRAVDLFGQIEVYDRWLSSQNLDTGFVLLIHGIIPPGDFLTDDKTYQTPLRSVTTWQSIHTWFNRYGQKNNEGDIKYELARNLAEYLRDQNMS